MKQEAILVFDPGLLTFRGTYREIEEALAVWDQMPTENKPDRKEYYAYIDGLLGRQSLGRKWMSEQETVDFLNKLEKI